MSYGESNTYESNQSDTQAKDDAAADLATDAQAVAQSLLSVIDFLHLHFPGFEGLPADPRDPVPTPEAKGSP